MKTPREKYNNDPAYHQLVTMLENFIDMAQFSPSEIREAAMMACINYEMRHIRRVFIPHNKDIENALKTLDESWASRKRGGE